MTFDTIVGETQSNPGKRLQGNLKKPEFLPKKHHSIENHDCTSRNRPGLLRSSSSSRPGMNSDSSVMTIMNSSNARNPALASQRRRGRATSSMQDSAGNAAKANNHPKSVM